MIKRFIASVCLCVMGIMNSVAADITVAEPEFAGDIYIVSADGTELEDLEVQTIKQKTQASAGMWLSGGMGGSVRMRYEVEKTASPKRLSNGNEIYFLFKSTDNSINPKNCLAVFKLDVAKKRRYAEMAKTSTFGGTESSAGNSLPFTAKKYGESSYLIKVTGLEPGEYGINSSMDASKFYMFGIDR
ncbi:MAG: hypothetical protein KBT22_09360 [Bacteroidales bacterium]|nr:hypothetical protein [Candidatus Scybalocola fimicaballi]